MEKEKNTIVDKFEKGKKYRQLCGKLAGAIKLKFWFEAIMIEYAIFEDRTASVLYYTKLASDKDINNANLSNKLGKISKVLSKHALLNSCFERKLVDDIFKWKDKQNTFVHNACNKYDSDLAEKLAKEGKILFRQFDSATEKLKRRV